MPTNWSHVDLLEYQSTIAPLRYSVADAQNIIVKQAVEKEVEWLLLIEHDNVLPPNTFIMLNQYMLSHEVPVVSGLYFTKTEPPEPMIYRKLGGGYYTDWKMGDKVWCSGIPTGTFLSGNPGDIPTGLCLLFLDASLRWHDGLQPIKIVRTKY